MEPTAWAHLPNAAHIDRVLAHAKAHPEKWKGAVWGASIGAARSVAWGAAGDATRGADQVEALSAALDAGWYTTEGAVWDAASDALAALAAWDYAGDLLAYTPEQLKFLVNEGVHAAVLLYPAVLAMKEVT